MLFPKQAVIALTLLSTCNVCAEQVIFAVDESGSMGDDIAAIKANINTIFSSLTQPQVALVGYGSFSHSGPYELSHLHTDFTSDSAAFAQAVNGLVIDGGWEDAYRMAEDVALNTLEDGNKLSFSGDPFCLIVVTDELTKQGSTTAANVIQSMKAKKGIFFGVLSAWAKTADDQSIADATGGALFDLTDFENDPTSVTTAVLNKCQCTFPKYLVENYALITRDNASIAAAEVYSGLAIGGELFVNRRNQIQINSHNKLSPTVYQSFRGLVGTSRLQCNGCTIQEVAPPLDPLDVPGIDWDRMEWLAQNLVNTTSPDGVYKIFVVNHGGSFDQADFLGLEAQDYDLGKTLVVFNTAEPIELRRTKYGRKWGPSVLAPFSTVTLASNNDFADGTIIARNFISPSQGQMLHGNFYKGPLLCVPALT